MTQPTDPYRELRRKLSPLGLRLRLGDTLLFASATFWIATLAALGVLIAGRLTPIANLLMWAAVPLVVWLLVVLGYVLLRPLSPERIARRVDASLDLRERLSTALELHDSHADDDLSALQQQDASHIAQTLKARQLPLRVHRTALLLALVPLLAGVALLFVPNPQDAVLAEQEEVSEALEEVVEDIEQLEEEIAEDERLTPEEREDLERQLAELEERLRQNPGDREEALADLSAAEARLQQELDPENDARRAALEQMARNLEQMNGEQNQQTRSDLEEAAERLEQMAEDLESMSEEERQELADQLAEQAARLAEADPQTAQDLSEASQSLSEGDLAEAAEQLQEAAGDVQQAQGELADQEATQGALSQLQESRGRIAQAGEMQEGQIGEAGEAGEAGEEGEEGEAGQLGEAGEGGEGDQDGQLLQPGQGGEQGQGSQQGSTSGAGGTDQDTLGEGQSGNTTNIDPNSGSSSGQGAGSSEGDTVYQPFDPSGETGEREFIEGQLGDEGQTQSQQGNANLPGVSNPSVVPYEEVFPEYSQSASEALDRGYIPPHLKNYVRDYFSQLEPGE